MADVAGTIADKIEIRRCLAEDCMAIAALGRSVWGDWANGQPLSRQLIDMGHPVFVAYAASGHLAGYCVAFSEADGVTGYVLSITLHPDYRQKGIGARLLKSVVSDFRVRKMQSINTAVSDENIASKSLFASLGFREAKRIENYYKPGDVYCILNLKL